MHMNSKFYSAQTPPRLANRILPHITIQCPVYKEGLASVIAPTVKSIKQAISTYELQGGSANMFINDDGLQLIDEEERQARIEFYADHSIGWVARPKHGLNGFQRKGKFKKVCFLSMGSLLHACLDVVAQSFPNTVQVGQGFLARGLIETSSPPPTLTSDKSGK